MEKNNLPVSGSTNAEMSNGQKMNLLGSSKKLSFQKSEEIKNLNNPLYLMGNDPRFISLDMFFSYDRSLDDMDFE